MRFCQVYIAVDLAQHLGLSHIGAVVYESYALRLNFLEALASQGMASSPCGMYTTTSEIFSTPMYEKLDLMYDAPCRLSLAQILS